MRQARAAARSASRRPQARHRHRGAAREAGERAGRIDRWCLCGCGQRRGSLTLRVLIARMRHDGCGGLAGKIELLTGIDGVSSRPVRRIVLWAG